MLLVDQKDLVRLKNSYTHLPLKSFDLQNDLLSPISASEIDPSQVTDIKLTYFPYQVSKHTFSKCLYSTGEYFHTEIGQNSDEYLLTVNSGYTKVKFTEELTIETTLYIKDFFFISNGELIVTFPNNGWVQFYAIKNMAPLKS